MRVYRIEHPNTGNGPYNYTMDVDGIGYAHNDDLHPSKGEEFPDQWFDPKWYCCFDSMDCLHIWFEGWHNALAFYGFKLATYEIADLKVIHGKSQSIFVKESARLVRYDDIVNPF